MDEFDFGAKSKKIAGTIIAKSGTFLCVVLILVNILYRCFASASFDTQALLSVGTDAVIYTASAWLCWIICHDNGKQAGRADKTYIQEVESYTSLRQKMFCRLNEIVKWCATYVARDLEQRRHELLYPNDISAEEYEIFKKMKRSNLKAEGLLGYQRRAVVRARRLRPLKLNASRLLTGFDVNHKHHLAPHPNAVDAKTTAAALSRITITSLFIVNITFNVVWGEDPLLAILSGAACCLPLVWICYRGYRLGFQLITQTAANYCREQKDYLTLCHDEIGAPAALTAPQTDSATIS